MTEELDRAVMEAGLQNFLLQPCGLSEDSSLVPDLLRTRVEPEVERDLQKLKEQYTENVGGKSNVSRENIAKRIVAFNAFVDDTVEQFQDLRETLTTQVAADASPKRSAPAAEDVLKALSHGEGLRH